MFLHSVYKGWILISSQVLMFKLTYIGNQFVCFLPFSCVSINVIAVLGTNGFRIKTMPLWMYSTDQRNKRVSRWCGNSHWFLISEMSFFFKNRPFLGPFWATCRGFFLSRPHTCLLQLSLPLFTVGFCSLSLQSALRTAIFPLSSMSSTTPL